VGTKADASAAPQLTIMARIAVGGFQHETNTFSPVRATFADFEAPDAWPGLTRGEALFDAVAGINLPAAGFVKEARGLHHELAPLLWCQAQPSGHVARDAYERVSAMLIEQLRSAGAINAVYLDLHGAMVAEHVDDADGELLRRLRAVVGPNLPIVASLDFHANVSPQMARQASALVSFRTYPHVDMAASGARAARCLHDLIGRPRPAHSLEQIEFLMPLTSQSTLVEPMRSLMGEAIALERTPVAVVGLTAGFPAADVAECGPAVYACGHEAAAARAAAQALADRVRAREREFALEIHSIDQALAIIRSHASARGRPIILVDTQDNPGAGGNADTMTLIGAMIESRIESVLAGIICDPQAAARAHAAGLGATVALDLGSRSGTPGDAPLHDEFRVQALGDGRFTGTGPFYLGSRFELGPMALLACGGVRIAVASRKQQAADQAMFRHLGVEPADHAVLLLKSSVHFRADFGAMASRVLVVAGPGPNVPDPSQLPFRKLRPGVRLRPRAAGHAG
jgi:microcystin degradation protein MlrC